MNLVPSLKCNCIRPNVSSSWRRALPAWAFTVPKSRLNKVREGIVSSGHSLTTSFTSNTLFSFTTSIPFPMDIIPSSSLVPPPPPPFLFPGSLSLHLLFIHHFHRSPNLFSCHWEDGVFVRQIPIPATAWDFYSSVNQVSVGHSTQH